MDEFEGFETKAFVGRLLGKGDWTGFMDKIKVHLHLAAIPLAPLHRRLSSAHHDFHPYGHAASWHPLWCLPHQAANMLELITVLRAIFLSNVMFGTQDVVPEDSMKEEIMDSIQKGNFTMRILKDQLQNILKMGPVGQVMGMIPGFANNMMPKVIVMSQMITLTVIMSLAVTLFVTAVVKTKVKFML